jgi:excisionase family DNA binding protein
MSKYLRPKELCEFLSVSPRLVRKWQAEKVIPFIKVGKTILFDPNKVQTALERFERNAGVVR